MRMRNIKFTQTRLRTAMLWHKMKYAIVGFKDGDKHLKS